MKKKNLGKLILGMAAESEVPIRTKQRETETDNRRGNKRMSAREPKVLKKAKANATAWCDLHRMPIQCTHTHTH